MKKYTKPNFSKFKPAETSSSGQCTCSGNTTHSA